MNRKKVLIMGNIFSIRLTDEDKIHLQQRMDETGKNVTEVFKSAIYFTEIDADLVDEIISNIGYYRKRTWRYLLDTAVSSKKGDFNTPPVFLFFKKKTAVLSKYFKTAVLSAYIRQFCCFT